MNFVRQLFALKLVRVCIAFAAALAWCAFILCFRTLWTWNLDYAFLVWNLALAILPLIFSFLFVQFANKATRVIALFLWILFLPNAPYIITDFIHLRHLTSGPIWLDIILLFSCSITGLAIAFYSLSEIHDFFAAQNRPSLGWTIAIASSFLCGFGIYLGRFLRWRSIDIFHQPLDLASAILTRILNPLLHPRAWGVTLAFGLLFIVTYSLLRFFLLTHKKTRSDCHWNCTIRQSGR
jgi:uncharacterized membrane protein